MSAETYWLMKIVDMAHIYEELCLAIIGVIYYNSLNI